MFPNDAEAFLLPSLCGCFASNCRFCSNLPSLLYSPLLMGFEQASNGTGLSHCVLKNALLQYSKAKATAASLGLDMVTTHHHMCIRLQVASALADDQTVRACATLLVRSIRCSILAATPPSRVDTYSPVEYQCVTVSHFLPRTCT
jgi:hypothetical protein